MAQKVTVTFHVNITNITKAAWDAVYTGSDISRTWYRYMQLIVKDASGTTINLAAGFEFYDSHTPASNDPIALSNTAAHQDSAPLVANDYACQFSPAAGGAVAVGSQTYVAVFQRSGADISITASGTNVSGVAVPGTMVMNDIVSIDHKWTDGVTQSGVWDAHVTLTDFSSVITDTVETHFWNDRVKCTETD